MKRICVFCGSSPGRKPAYISTAVQLGKALVQRDIELVYGGAKVGLMGKLAETVLAEGGKVIGVITKDLLKKDVAFTGLPELRVTNNMHERKSLMIELSQGFVGLPGGFGTLEEFFEVLTWAQLGIHSKPCGVINVQGYFTKMVEFLDNSVKEQFLVKAHREMLLINESAEGLLEMFESYNPTEVDKAAWLLKMNRNAD